MAVRYAENLTLFKSATGAEGDRGRERNKKQNRSRKSEYKSATEICQLGNTSRTSVFNGGRLLEVIVNGDDRGEGGGLCNEVSEFCLSGRWCCLMSCWPTSYYLSVYSLRNSHAGHPTGTETCVWMLAGCRRRGGGRSGVCFTLKYVTSKLKCLT